MQKHGPREGKIVIKPPVVDDLAEREGITKQHSHKAKCACQHAISDIHITDAPATHLLETLEKDDPYREVDEVVQQHSDDLGYERDAVLHGGEKIGLPDSEEEFYFFHEFDNSSLILREGRGEGELSSIHRKICHAASICKNKGRAERDDPYQLKDEYIYK